MISRHIFFIPFIGALVLLSFAAGQRGLGNPPETTSAADPNAFGAVARDVEKSVLALGYPKATADELARLARDWKCEQWKQDLAQARAGAAGDRAADVARVEETTLRALYEKIQKEVVPCDEKEDAKYFYLSTVVKDRKAQCLGYSQLFYILGKAIGLSVQVISVLESGADPLPAGTSRVACLVGLSDDQAVIVDLARHYVSAPFVLKDTFVEKGNDWQLKSRGAAPRFRPRIQLLNENGLAGCIYSNLGLAYLKAGRPDRAIGFCDKAIQLNPTLAEAFSNRGSAHDALKQYPQAISDCTKAIELNPRSADAFFHRGSASAAVGQYQRAGLDFSRAIDLDPHRAAAFYQRGYVFGVLGQFARAVADFDKAIELDPNHAEALRGRGSAYSALGQFPRAVEDFTKALELDPKNADTLLNRGNAYGKLRQHERAIADYTKALELKPKWAIAFHNRGSEYSALKQHKKAIADYTTALDLNPNLVEAYAGRAVAHASLGEKADARKDLQKAMALDPAIQTRVRIISDQFDLGL